MAAPAKPAIVVTDLATSGDLRVAFTANDGSHTMHALYRRSDAAAWSVWGVTRVGSGNLDISGLDDDFLYQLVGLEEDTGYYSFPSDPATGTPTDGAAPTATGSISLILENVRTLLAASASFQSLVSAVDAAAAKAYIHYPAADSGTWARPGAMIDHEQGSPEHPLVGRGGGNTYGETGQVEIVIEADIGASYQAKGQEELAYLEFANVIGAIASEIKALAGTGSYLHATNFAFTVARADPDEEAVAAFWYRAVIAVTVGVS